MACQASLEFPIELGLFPGLMGSTAPAWVSWVSLALAIASPIALLGFRTWIVAWITKGVEHDFNVKLENLRATLKTSEDQFRSDLRVKETEIDALRNTVLSGSAGRQALLDKRRFEAVEKIWTAVNDFAQLRALAQSMAGLNLEFITANVRNQKMQQFLSMIDELIAPDPRTLKNVARDERPFVPEITWAYFSAFSTVLHFNLMRLKTLTAGIDGADK